MLSKNIYGRIEHMGSTWAVGIFWSCVDWLSNFTHEMSTIVHVPFFKVDFWLINDNVFGWFFTYWFLAGLGFAAQLIFCVVVFLIVYE